MFRVFLKKKLQHDKKRKQCEETILAVADKSYLQFVVFVVRTRNILPVNKRAGSTDCKRVVHQQPLHLIAESSVCFCRETRQEQCEDAHNEMTFCVISQLTFYVFQLNKTSRSTKKYTGTPFQQLLFMTTATYLLYHCNNICLLVFKLRPPPSCSF